MNRREFLGTLAAAGVVGAMGAQEATAPVFKTKLKKALIRPRFNAKVAKELLDAGFPGVEVYGADSVAEARAARKLAQDHGLVIHSCMGGWQEFNAKDPAKRRAAIEDAKRNLEHAEAYGTSVMLIVAGFVRNLEIPKPSQFDLAFDPKTLMLERATAQGGFDAYVKVQNDATKYVQDALAELIPCAAEHGVMLGLENVWSNLWVKPDFAASFIRSFRSPWVKCYLDLGNHVRYAPVEDWLKAMGEQIVKLHIKDFKINRAAPNEGKFVRLGEGSIDWKSVRRAIDAVGYSGWVSIEENGWSNAEYSKKMESFFAGKGI